MSKLQDLRALRNTLSKDAQELNGKYAAGVAMPEADAKKLDEILAKVEAVDVDLAREKRMAELQLETPEAQQAAALNAATRTPGAHSGENKALKAFLAGGISNLSPEDRNVMMARQTPEIRNAMSTSTTTEGGYTTALEYQRSLETMMKAYGGMRSVATAIRTGSGITMNFPKSDPTAEVGEIVGQNTAVTGLDTTFGNITLDVYKYSSKKIALPFELIQDSFIDIEAYIQSVLAMRLGRIQNTHFTVGTGTGQPNGLLTASSVGKTGTTGQTLSVIYDDLVDLEHSLDPAYRNQAGVGYMMNDASLKVIRKIKDAQNRPIFVPGYEANAMINGGAPDTIMGRPITINQDMPVMAANAKSILFGQFSKYTIRDVMDLTLFRMTDSAFTLLGQVGFVAFLRTGGNLIDAGGATRYYANSAT
ncbi:MAG: phage major capsid protein [Phenylobacterium zucineum]|nr:MAG: phage major capsid protein [Phenylobacterium zucineum]